MERESACRNDPDVGFSLSGAFASMYMEHNLVKSVFYHDRSVKLLVASFSELFGSDKGREVQRYKGPEVSACLQHPWSSLDRTLAVLRRHKLISAMVGHAWVGGVRLPALF